MANFNKVFLIGRLTREPEIRATASGNKIANIGFAVNNRRKNGDHWEDEPVFVDMTAFGKTAELVEQYLRKGSQAHIEGKLSLDSWTDKTTGDKRTKLKVIVETVQFLDAKKSDSEQSKRNSDYQPGEDDFPPPPPPPAAGEIPF